MDFKPVSGKVSKGDFIVVYGNPGLGKTSFGISAPNPVVIDPTGRIEHYHTVKRLVPKTWLELIEMVKWATTSKFDSVILDETNFAEEMAKEYIHERDYKKYKSFALVKEKGGQYNVLSEEYKKVLPLFLAIRDAGKNLIIVAHPEVKEMNDPLTLEPYIKYQLGLTNGLNAMLKRFSDALFFINTEVMNAKDGDETIKRAVSTGKRYIFTEYHQAYDAKNLFGLPDKIELPKTGAWDLIQSLKGSPDDPKVLIRQIESFYNQMTEDEVKWAQSKTAEGSLEVLKETLKTIREGYSE